MNPEEGILLKKQKQKEEIRERMLVLQEKLLACLLMHFSQSAAS